MKNKLAPFVGLLAIGILYFAILLTVIPFVGAQGESFSFLNHFISELGNPEYSERYYVFNTGLIIAGIGFGSFAYCMGGFIQTKLANACVWIGMIAAVFCSGVGLFPCHLGSVHFIVAVTFFTLMTFAMTLYSYCILKDETSVFPKYIAYYGFCAMFSFILLILAPKDLMGIQDEQKELFDRPDLWFVAITEWMVFFFLTTWVVLVSVYLLKQRRSHFLPIPPHSHAPQA